MNAHIIASLTLILAAGTAATSESPHGYWYQPVAETPSERLLRDALVSAAGGGRDGRLQALSRAYSSQPGTVAAGLARLESGLLLLESDRHAEAVAMLGHADVRLTALNDHALLASARALLRAGDAQTAGARFAAAAQAQSDGPLICPALIEGGEVYSSARRFAEAADALTRALAACPTREAQALLALAQVRRQQGDAKSAALLLDRLDRDHPASSENRQAAPLLKSLTPLLPPKSPQQRRSRALATALALFDAGRYREAEPLLLALRNPERRAEQDDLIAVRLGRAQLALGRRRPALSQLAAVPAGSPHAAEAAYFRARSETNEDRRLAGYEAVAQCCAGTPWAREALMRLANSHLAQGRAVDAVPYFRRLLAMDAQSSDAMRATWHVAWSDLRHGQHDVGAQTLERAARLWPDARQVGGFLYWAARARLQLGETDRARSLLLETVRRFKHSYHGMRARELDGSLPAQSSAGPATPAFVRPGAVDAGADIPEPWRTRVRQLVMIDRLDKAIDELKSLPPASGIKATIAWLEWRSGRLRPAIIAMKQAYPEWIGEAGDLLPESVWRILYPMQFEDLIVPRAIERGLDPALVAALVCQESTFQSDAVSRAGARGLMQIMPATGRQIARELNQRYRPSDLYEPSRSLDFGLHYLRDMIDSFGGRVERALAAYNAGPHRVAQWTAAKPDMSAEEFIESIPFTETRFYVINVLANQAHYRRIYAFGSPVDTARASGGENP